MMPYFKSMIRLLCLVLLLTSVTVADENESEYKIKAGYLYNFIKFVTWPTLPAPFFNICVVGSDPFRTLIDPIQNRSAFGLPIKVLRIKSATTLPNCQIVFLGAENHKDMLDKLLTNIPIGGQTLTVGEEDTFAERGGMIGMVDVDGKVKLNINVNAVQQSGLIMSGKLLEIAELVEGEHHD